MMKAAILFSLLLAWAQTGYSADSMAGGDAAGVDNGELTVRLPAEFGAQIHLDTSQGEIFSDFEVDVQPSEPTVIRNDDGGGSKVRIESVIIANVNGGGPIIRMNSLNGDINIRKAD